jgi:hypothetical protein
MRPLRWIGMIVGGLLAVSCQPGPPAGPEEGTPTPVPAAAGTASPTAPPEAALEPGPVKYLNARLISIVDGTAFREPPFDDGEGHQIVNLGETVVFDVTPRNVANHECETRGEPSWVIRDNKDSGNHDYLTLLGSSNPFLLRMRANARSGKALVHLWSEVDGVASNHLWVYVR